MSYKRKLSREPSPACTRLYSITEDFLEAEREDSILVKKDLQMLVSKLEILRSFSILTPDTVLAEQIAEAMQNKQEGVNKDIEHKDESLICLANLLSDECIELNEE